MKEKIKSEDFIKAFGSGVCAKVDNAPTVEIPVARWDCYCEGQKVGYEKADKNGIKRTFPCDNMLSGNKPNIIFHPHA